jgi:hypothetical protein
MPLMYTTSSKHNKCFMIIIIFVLLNSFINDPDMHWPGKITFFIFFPFRVSLFYFFLIIIIIIIILILFLFQKFFSSGLYIIFVIYLVTIMFCYPTHFKLSSSSSLHVALFLQSDFMLSFASNLTSCRLLLPV